MPDKKLTDEIIKALECCISAESCCECGYTKMCDGTTIHQFALDLINRLQAENEKLAKDWSDLTIEKDELFDIAETQKAEIEKLKAKCENTQVGYNFAKEETKQWKEEANRYQNLWCEAEKDIQTAKAEAYKECIEKAKEVTKKEKPYNYGNFIYLLNNLLKEKVGEQLPLNDVKCIDCEYLEFELPYAVCSKAYKGIVAPDDCCGKGKLKEMVGEDNSTYIDKQN